MTRYEQGEEVLFSGDDDILSDLKSSLEDATSEEVRAWALEMIRKPLSYLKGRYDTVFGLDEVVNDREKADRKTLDAVWRTLVKASAEEKDTADRLTLRSSAAFLRTTWEKDNAMHAMVLLLSTVVWEDGPDEGIRGVPIVVFKAEEILDSIRKKTA